MAISRESYSHKVYFHSLEEYEQVRIRAKLRGAGSISSHLRDLAVADLREAERVGLVPRHTEIEEKKAPPMVENIIFEMPEEQTEEEYLKAILGDEEKD